MLTAEEFRTSLNAFAERAQKIREHIRNEEATKLHLILPFIQSLGYDTTDPSEVSAEHSADFSEKYKNRVDYAILKSGVPTIAIECKTIGNGKKDDRGQLKSYFNASKTVKLGILTDGILYEFFVDSQEPNMMDDEPFLAIDFDTYPKAQISDTILQGLYSLTKWHYDPETVAENARRNITHRAFLDYLTAQFAGPSTEFTRFLLKENEIKHIRQNAIEGYREIAKAALNDVFTSQVLRRLDLSESVLRAPTKPEVLSQKPEVSESSADLASKSIVTTEAERTAFEAVRMRLAFLSGGKPDSYAAISKVNFRDYQGKMAVFYVQERKGRLLDIIEGKDGVIKYALHDGGDMTLTADLSLLDARLQELFEKRIGEV
jgi:hypothetical protein